MLPRLADKPKIKSQIMHARDSKSQQLLGLDQMPQIRLRIISAEFAADTGIDEEADDGLAPTERADNGRRDCRSIKDERRGVVHKTLAFENRDDAARHRHARDDRRRGHGVGR